VQGFVNHGVLFALRVLGGSMWPTNQFQETNLLLKIVSRIREFPDLVMKQKVGYGWLDMFRGFPQIFRGNCLHRTSNTTSKFLYILYPRHTRHVGFWHSIHYLNGEMNRLNKYLYTVFMFTPCINDNWKLYYPTNAQYIICRYN